METKPVRLAVVLLLALLATATDLSQGYKDDQKYSCQLPVVHTTSGPLRGKYLDSDILAFRGIPYAQPPTGPLRFEPPKPIETPSYAIIDATRHGRGCVQHPYKSVDPMPLDEDEQSEDCLTANVYIPQRPNVNDTTKELLPVMVWIYGGGFGEGYTFGSDPTTWLRHNPDIIVVTFNYRLNIFGYPNTPAISNEVANAGLRDQRLALVWIRDNIRVFGGDPSRIVVAGQSAGSQSLSTYLYAYPDDPILTGAILMSGQPQITGTNDYSEFERVASIVGCRDPEHREKELECMKGVDAFRLKRAVSNETLNQYGMPHGGAPRYDNSTVFSPGALLQRVKEGKVARVPVLMGHTDNEGDNAINWTPRGNNYTFADIVGFSSHQCPVAVESSTRVALGIPTWRYRYRGRFPSLQVYPWLRSYHGQDVYILFGITPQGDRTILRPFERAASGYMMAAWAAFVQNPEKGLLEFGWPLYNPNSTSLVELFENNTAGARYTNPEEYDRGCENPPLVPYTEYLKQPPPCDPCFD